MSIKLEEGKFYKTRSGLKVECIKELPAGKFGYTHICVSYEDDGWAAIDYQPNGRYFEDGTDENDIVSEWTEAEMTYYTKKPLAIQAIQYAGDNWGDVIKQFPDIPFAIYKDPHKIVINTLEGEMKVSVWDYIIRGVKGEYYPCKPDIFEMTYDKGTGNGKSLHNTDVNGATKNVKDIQFFGDGNIFKLIAKASSEDEGWMKSTKAMETGNGCVVQVTTQQRNPDGSYSVAEALTFVPDARIIKGKKENTQYVLCTKSRIT